MFVRLLNTKTTQVRILVGFIGTIVPMASKGQVAEWSFHGVFLKRICG